MSGRPIIPTDRKNGPLSATRPADFFTTMHRAIVVSVDAEKGKLTAQFEDTAGQRDNINVPFGFISSPINNRRKSAWSRYIPQEGDIVVLGFDTNHTPRIISYSLISYELLSVLNSETGYQFSTLQPGEWDQRSSGGAYFRGDRTGLLFLSGGLTSISLDKKRFEIRSSAGLEKFSANQSVWRRGQVKRSLVPFTPETVIKFPAGGAPATPANAVQMDLYESTVDLRSPVPGTPLGFPMAFSSLGNVVNPELSTAAGDAYGVGPVAIKRFPATVAAGAPATATARFFARIYASDPVSQLPAPPTPPVPGTLPFEIGIDQLGNVFINNLGVGALGGVRWFTSGTLFELAGAVAIQLSSPIIRLGGPLATVPAVKGTEFATAFTAYFTAVASASSTLAGGSGSPQSVITYGTAMAAAATAMAATIAGMLAPHILMTEAPIPSLLPNILTG